MSRRIAWLLHRCVLIEVSPNCSINRTTHGAKWLINLSMCWDYIQSPQNPGSCVYLCGQQIQVISQNPNTQLLSEWDVLFTFSWYSHPVCLIWQTCFWLAHHFADANYNAYPLALNHRAAKVTILYMLQCHNTNGFIILKTIPYA